MKKIFACLLVAVFGMGCGSGVKPPPKSYPVTGTVTYNGSPVVGATVSFWAPNAPLAGAGVTDDHGEFKLTTPAGDNLITVTKPVGAIRALPSDVALKDPAKMSELTAVAPPVKKKASKKDPPPPKPPVPEMYSTVKTTPLKEQVTPKGPNSFELKLSD